MESALQGMKLYCARNITRFHYQLGLVLTQKAFTMERGNGKACSLFNSVERALQMEVTTNQPLQSKYSTALEMLNASVYSEKFKPC